MKNRKKASQIATMPTLHNFAFQWSSRGFRASHIVWKVALKLQKTQQGWVRLVNGFVLDSDFADWNKASVYKGQYERSLSTIVKHLNSWDCYIDVGANIGYVTYLVTHQNQSKKVVVFEPVESNLEHLRVSLNESGVDVDSLPYAISDKTGESTIYGIENPHHSGSASLSRRQLHMLGAKRVTTKRLDEFIDEKLDKYRNIFLKIDTEGHEREVIAGLGKLQFRERIYALIIEISPQFGSIDYLNYLYVRTKSDYLWFAIEERGYIKKVPILNEVTLSQVLEIPTQFNLLVIRKLAIRDLSSIKMKRLSKSVPQR